MPVVRNYLLIFFTFISISIYADTIYLNNDTTVKGKILQITGNSIEYDPDGSKNFDSLPKEKVNRIVYDDGKVYKPDADTDNESKEYSDSKEEHQKSSWYIGFAFMPFTFADGSVTYSNGYTESVEDAFNGAGTRKYFIDFGAGGIINPKLCIGGSFNFLVISDPSVDDTFAEVYSLLITATYFPFVEGLLFKASFGKCHLLGGSAGFSVLDSSGYNLVAGAGYAWNFGGTFNLCVNADYAYQYYNENGVKSSSYWVLYVSFYWF